MNNDYNLYKLRSLLLINVVIHVFQATEELDAQLASLESGSLSDLSESNSSHLNESLDNSKQTSPATTVTEQESHNNDHENKDSSTVDKHENHEDTVAATALEDKVDGLEVSEMPVKKTDTEKDSTALENKIDIIKEIPTDADECAHKPDDLSPSSLQLDESAVSGYNGGESLLNLSCSSCSELSQVRDILVYPQLAATPLKASRGT